MRIIFLMAILFSSFNIFANPANLAEVRVYELENDAQLKIKFFIHQNPTVDEFILARDKVERTVEKLLDLNYLPKVEVISVGLTSKTMIGGNVVLEDKKLFVAATATDEEVELGLLSFFDKTRVVRGPITYFEHNSPLSSQFTIGLETIDKIINKIFAAGFVLRKEELKIGIAPKTMTSGDIVEVDGELFVFFEASPESIERRLLPFFEYPN